MTGIEYVEQSTGEITNLDALQNAARIHGTKGITKQAKMLIEFNEQLDEDNFFRKRIIRNLKNQILCHCQQRQQQPQQHQAG